MAAVDCAVLLGEGGHSAGGSDEVVEAKLDMEDIAAECDSSGCASGEGAGDV